MESVGKKYNIIYADPPWQFKVWSNRGMSRSAENHYSTQSLQSLTAFNIPAICENDCVLLMWATFPCLKGALELAEAWGFVYKTVAFTWIKQNKNNEKLFKGMGYYTRANAEVVLLFTKGKPLKRICRNVEQVLISKRDKHSKKPREIRERIVNLFGDVPRVELFARSCESLFPNEEFEGWDVFGNEVSSSIKLPD
ncbi:MAG: DNA methyltransferase [Sediminibacterium magnilacihabitans]|jgi:N6-adenosine-specific RNA methylase IME4|nr:DNA methyltransferase [Sediminibacterium magnilacihabitans]PQV61525.1 site-specific DNA-methyltransferase (adenine-specific) [Sediminibacterium magnilacihabitans]